jgi:hypothetical protein
MQLSCGNFYNEFPPEGSGCKLLLASSLFHTLILILNKIAQVVQFLPFINVILHSNLGQGKTIFSEDPRELIAMLRKATNVL